LCVKAFGVAAPKAFYFIPGQNEIENRFQLLKILVEGFDVVKMI
jgi:hypothetical protein